MSTLGLKLVKTKYRDVVCGECSRTFITKEPRKLFCDPCGIARRNSLIGRKVSLLRQAQNPALRIIAQASASNSTRMLDAFTKGREYAWQVTFTTPYSLNSSKNRRWSNNRSSVVYLSDQVRKYEYDLIALTRNAMKGIHVRQAKLWVGLFVQKLNHRSDAINVVDTICDAIKKAIDLDDRWFAIDLVDWEITKHDPQIFIRIRQEETQDMMACSHCGIIQFVELFSVKNGNPFNRDRVCRPCRKIVRQEAKRLGQGAAS